VAWLSQLFSEPEVISPSNPQEWLARYELLEAFLREALSWSMAYHMASISAGHETSSAAWPTAAPFRHTGEAVRRKGSVGANMEDASGSEIRVRIQQNALLGFG
jgi:hypothetical protein